MSSECHNCATASKEVHGGFDFSCIGCRARHLSKSFGFGESRRTGKLLNGYRHALAANGLTHEQVKAAHASDAINRIYPAA